MSKLDGVPVFLLVLDGFGTILLILGVMGLTGVDIGLPVLQTIWPLLIILGLGLMAPLIVWIIRKAMAAKTQQ